MNSACHLKPVAASLCAQSPGSRRSLAARAADFRPAGSCMTGALDLITVQIDTANLHILSEKTSLNVLEVRVVMMLDNTV